MIRFVKQKDIDKQKWDACIKVSPQQFIFVYSWYLDVACPGWNALVLNDYDAVFPLLSASKLGIKYLYQPFFTRHFGVYAQHELKKEIEQEFYTAIPKEFKYWDFCLHPYHTITPLNTEVKQRVFQLLNLNVDYEIIQAAYSENANRNIKRAAKQNLHLIKDFKPSILISLFKQWQGEKLSFTEKNYAVLKKLMTVSSGHATTFCWAIANEKKEYLAGAFFMEINNRIIYLKGFSSEQGKKIGAMHFLFDAFIKLQSNKNKVVDFGGSSVASVARFYKNFGATDCLYLHIHSNRLPRYIKWLKE